VTTHTTTSFPAFAGRLIWMIVGPFALAVCALGIAGQHDGWLGPPDLIYFILLAGTLAGRWMECRSGPALTATGEPATAEDLRRYARGLGLLGLGIWVAANLVGNRVLGLFG
jgi:hypothetical protein